AADSSAAADRVPWGRMAASPDPAFEPDRARDLLEANHEHPDCGRDLVAGQARRLRRDARAGRARALRGDRGAGAGRRRRDVLDAGGAPTDTDSVSDRRDLVEPGVRGAEQLRRGAEHPQSQALTGEDASASARRRGWPTAGCDARRYTSYSQSRSLYRHVDQGV